jgi:hypothetical protein
MSIVFQSWRLPRSIAGIALALCCLIVGLASRGSAQSLPAKASGAGVRFAIADFDGDSRPDLATVQVGKISASQARYWIHFELSAGARQLIDVTAPVGGVEIAPRDVNGDDILDLVVTTAWLNRPVAVLLNDGHGNFTYQDASAYSGMTWRFATRLSGDVERVRDTSAESVQHENADQRGRDSRVAHTASSRILCSRTRFLASCPKFLVFGRAPPRLAV